MADIPDTDASFERALRTFLRKQQHAAEGCPDPGMLSAYYEHALAEDEVSSIEEHLAACVDCQAEVALLARLDTDSPPAVVEKPAVELTVEQLEEPVVPEPPAVPEEPVVPARVEAPVEEPPVKEPPSVEAREQSEAEAAATPFVAPPDALRRSRRRSSRRFRPMRWVASAAIAATAVIAVSVTYRFAVDDAARRALDVRRESPASALRAQPAAPPQEPNVQEEPPASLDGRRKWLEQDKPAPPAAVTEASPLAAPAPMAPQAEAPEMGAAGGALAKKNDDFLREERQREELEVASERARSEKAARSVTTASEKAAAESTRAKQKLMDEQRSFAAAASAASAAQAVANERAAPRVTPPAAFVVSSRVDEAVSWRFSGTSIERSGDSGRTWQQLSGAPSSIVAASAPSSTVCWAVGKDGTVVRTSDGRTWQTATSPTTADLVHVSAWSETSATVKSSDGSRFSTTDGGATWSRR